MKQKVLFVIGLVNLISIIFIGAHIVFEDRKDEKEIVFIDLAKIYNEFTYKIKIEEMLEQENIKRRFKSDSISAVLKQGLNYDKLKPQEVIKLEEELERSITEYEQGMNQLTKHYDQLIWNAINKYVSEFGKSNGEHLILGTKGEGNIMYASQGRDVSNEVVEFINEAFKNEK